MVNREQKGSTSRQLSRKGRIRVAAACIATLAAAQAASAATSYTFNVASGNWSDANSWAPNSASPVAGDTAIFTGASAQNVTFTGNQSVDTVTISNTGTTNFTPNQSGRTLTFTGNVTIAPGSGAVTSGLSNSSFTWAPTGTVSMTNNSSNLFTLFANGVSNTAMIGATAGTTVNVDGTGYTTFSGSILGGITLNVSNGTADLAGNNSTFAGVNVSSGKLYLRANNALGTPNVPATLTLSGTGNVGSIGAARTIPANISVAVTSDSVTFGDATANSSTIFSGPVTFSNNAHTLNLGANVTMNGAITIPTGGLIKDGTGMLALSNSTNSWTTSTTILAGTLNCGTSSIGGNPTIIMPVPMYIKTGATLGANLAGNLTFASLNDYDSTGGGSVVMGAGNADKMTVGTDGTSSTFSGVFSGTATNGNGEFYKVGAGTLTLKGASTFNGVMWVKEGVLQFISVRNTGSASSSSLFEPGTTTINAVSSGNNVTDLPAGTLVSTIQLGSGTTTGTLRFVGASLGTTNRAINLGGSTGGGTLDASGSGTAIFTVAGGVTNTPELVTNVSGPGGDKTLTLTGNNTGTFSGAITETGPGVINLYKDGTNLWTIQSSASTYTGTTIVNAGTLQAQSVSALGTGSAGVTVNTNGALTFNTASATGNFTKPITVSGPGTGAAGSGALNAGDNSNVNFTQPVTLAGNTTLLVTSLGTATYTGGITSGANNYNLLLVGGASAGGGGGNVIGGVSLGTGSLTKDQGGTWNLSGALNYSGATNVLAGNLVLGTNLTTSSNVAITGGLLKLTENGSHSRVIHTGTVAVTAGQLDVMDNKVITTTPAGTATAGVYAAGSVQQMVHDGFNNGAWSGAGIITSETNALGSSPLTTLAVATAGDIGKTSLGGQAVATTDTLVMYTYAGDVNLDGQINGDDYFRIDQGYTAGASGYENGDLNYDGVVNADDYFIIDSNYGSQTLGVFPNAAPVLSLGGVAAVPEPASLGLILVAAGALARRRRR